MGKFEGTKFSFSDEDIMIRYYQCWTESNISLLIGVQFDWCKRGRPSATYKQTIKHIDGSSKIPKSKD